MIDILLDATSAGDLSGFAGSSELKVFRTEPGSQMSDDFGSGFEGTPTLPLIDLTTMQVLHSDCYGFTPQYEGMTTWKACIDEYI